MLEEMDPFDNSTLILVEDAEYYNGEVGSASAGGFSDSFEGGGASSAAVNLTRRELLEIGVQDMLDGWRYQVGEPTAETGCLFVSFLFQVISHTLILYIILLLVE